MLPAPEPDRVFGWKKLKWIAQYCNRCLQLGDEKFSTWYQNMVSVLRILTSEPSGARFDIPFR